MTNTHEAMHQSTKAQLKTIIDRLERLEEEKAALAEDIKGVYAEAKSNGFDVKTLKKIISMRKKDSQDVLEEQMILSTYLHALGMDLPLFSGAAPTPRTEARAVREMEDA